VRELKHVAEYVVATIEDDQIETEDLPGELALSKTAPDAPARDNTSPMRRLSDELEELERLRMTEALAKTHGVKTRAAALLGMPIRTFNAKFKLYGL
jgi:DNA-binding NtrC family response regulator